MPEISLARLLTAANELNASDVHAQHGCAPMVRVDGVVRYLEVKPLTAEQMHHWTRDLLDEHSESILNREGSCDLTYTHSDEARFRVNVFNQNDVPAIALAPRPRQRPDRRRPQPARGHRNNRQLGHAD
jgi:twitching motility protein PilT